MCDDYNGRGELCEYDYDATNDRLTIHGRVDITASGFAQSCSDTYDNDVDGVTDVNDQDCLCGDPDGGLDEDQRCIGYGGDNSSNIPNSSTGPGFYCDTRSGTACCPDESYWDGNDCIFTSPCYTSLCNKGNYTPDWYGDYTNACVDTTTSPTNACAYVGVKYATDYYEYVDVTPY
jgi:hypothetical protein